MIYSCIYHQSLMENHLKNLFGHIVSTTARLLVYILYRYTIDDVQDDGCRGSVVRSAVVQTGVLHRDCLQDQRDGGQLSLLQHPHWTITNGWIFVKSPRESQLRFALIMDVSAALSSMTETPALWAVTSDWLWNHWTSCGGESVSIRQVRFTIPTDLTGLCTNIQSGLLPI